MNMKEFIQTLHAYVSSHEPNFGNGESVLTLLYEAYSQCNKMDNGTIKEDFNDLHRLMNGMPHRDMDKIIYPVCMLCRDHQRSGFADSVKVSMRLAAEIYGSVSNG